MHLPLYSNLNGSLEFNGQLRPTPKFFQEMLSTIGTLHRILFSFVNSTKILSIEWHKVEWKLGENYICWNSMILVTLLVVRTGASFIFHGGSGIEVLAWKKKLKKRVKLFEVNQLYTNFHFIENILEKGVDVVKVCTRSKIKQADRIRMGNTSDYFHTLKTT